MGRFDVVSLDMFQTLVNVDSRIGQVWRPILGEAFSETAASACAEQLLQHFHRNWSAGGEGGSFRLMKQVYQDSFHDHFRLSGMDYDSTAAVEHLFQGHRDCDFT